MPIFSESIEIAANARDVWALVGAPERASEWFPGIVESSVVDGIRSCVLANGQTIEERIVSKDDRAMILEYSVVSGMDVSHHLGHVQVRQAQGATVVYYRTEVEPENFERVLSRSVHAGLVSLKKLTEQRPD